MYGKYNKAKQQKLADAFEAGDIEVTVCPSCFIYFKQPLMPREKCHGCFTKKLEEDKVDHFSMGRKLRHWNNSNRKREVAEYRTQAMKAIRDKAKTVPKILRPIREIDPSKYKRDCLKCGREFLADSKFQRLCEHDRMVASDIGLSEYTHYYVSD